MLPRWMDLSNVSLMRFLSPKRLGTRREQYGTESVKALADMMPDFPHTLARYEDAGSQL